MIATELGNQRNNCVQVVRENYGCSALEERPSIQQLQWQQFLKYLEQQTYPIQPNQTINLNIS